MAGTTTQNRLTAVRGSDIRQIIIEHNKLVDDLETLRANYATGTGVTATAAAALTAAKIGNLAGTAVTT